MPLAVITSCLSSVGAFVPGDEGEIGDATGQARALSNLGNVEVGLCRYQEAAEHLGQACDQFRAAGDQVGLGLGLIGLGLIGLRQGRYDLAASQFAQASTAGRAAGDPGVQADALDNLGVVELAQGHYERSADYIRKALAVARETGEHARIGSPAADRLRDLLGRDAGATAPPGSTTANRGARPA